MFYLSLFSDYKIDRFKYKFILYNPDKHSTLNQGLRLSHENINKKDKR